MDDLAALGRVLKYIVNPTSCGQQSYQAHQDLSPGFEADLDDAITAMIQHPTDVAALVKRFEQLQDRHTNYNQEPVAAGNVTVQFNAQQEPRPWTQTSKRKCRAPPLLQEKTALGEQSAQLQANNWVNVVVCPSSHLLETLAQTARGLCFLLKHNSQEIMMSHVPTGEQGMQVHQQLPHTHTGPRRAAPRL
eukprot:TRINITY_DN60231_c0_g1_i2.p1 TRINITY_DN60231_c0_g1~~TRINITY_DN60231_c0_g1_i2.p1  ORF type:complete len:191 (+),score=14.53 TRINITY_DN60231_c0_g1_i2:212-784(+)